MKRRKKYFGNIVEVEVNDWLGVNHFYFYSSLYIWQTAYLDLRWETFHLRLCVPFDTKRTKNMN